MANYLKRICLATCMACLFSGVVAQAQNQPVTIKGIVLDSISGAGLDYVTLSLKTAEGKAVKTVLSGTKGVFTIPNIPAGAYRLSALSVGYSGRTITLKAGGEKDGVLNVGSLRLSPQNTKLREVSITGVKPIVKQEIDRISYDIQADPESKSNTVLDMMRKVPLITVDAEDNIKVKGSANFKVLINGRPSSMLARDPKEVFKSMPASNIQRVEVITTPPSKYEGEGLAGIINIITNKKVDQGYNGSIGLRQSFPNGQGVNASVTAKSGKFGIQGFGGLHKYDRPSGTSGSTRITTGTNPTRLEQEGEGDGNGKGLYSSIELSYEVDSLNLITASGSLNRFKNTYGNDQTSRLWGQDNSLSQSYVLRNNSESSNPGGDLSINYQLGFKRNKDQLMTASYRYNKYNNNGENRVLTDNAVNFPVRDYRQDNESGSEEQTAQIDYVHPLKKLNVEAGIKAIWRNNFSVYNQFNANPSGEGFILDPEKSNEFNYQQDVLGVYNSYYYKMKKWGFKAGLRLERTSIDANFKTNATKVDQTYTNFIPSVSAQRTFKNMSSMNFGYTQRIQRPGIWQLNPFVNQVDPRFISTGNPELDAALNHNFELSYSKFKKGSYTIGLSYTFANNTVQNVSIYRPEDNVTLTTFENVGKDKNAGLNASVNYPLTPRLNLNLNGSVSYLWIKGTFNGQDLSNDGLQGYLFSYIGYRMDKGWRAGVNGGFYSPSIILQGKSSSTVFTSFSLNKELLKKKATISMFVSNPWSKYRKWTTETEGPDFTQSSFNNSYFRNVGLSFNYRFGELKEGIKKNKRGIKNDDVSKGSSGGQTE